MDEIENLEEQINEVLKVINEFNNGDDEKLDDVIKVMCGIKQYTNEAYINYLKFYLLEKYLDIKMFIINKEIRNNPKYATVFQYCQDDLKFYFNTVRKLKKYMRKCQKTGDVDNLDVAYLITIYSSFILDNIVDYLKELKNITGHLNDIFYYKSKNDIHNKGLMDIEEIKKLIKIIEEDKIVEKD